MKIRPAAYGDRQRLRQSRFSLLELLTALVIAVILIGTAVGIGTRVTSGQAVETAGANFSRYLHLCRQQAIMERRRVALLVPHAADLDSDGDGKEDRLEAGDESTWGRAFRPCIVDNGNVFVEWVGGNGKLGPTSKWEYMPNGVFYCSSNAAITALETVTAVDMDEDGTGDAGSDCHAIVFKSTGSLTANSNPVLLIGRGSMDDTDGDGTPNLVVIDFRDTDADNPAVPSGAPSPIPWKPGGETAASWRVVAGTSRVRRLQINWLTGKASFDLPEYW